MVEKPRILVIDGEERIRRLLKQVLESCDYAVTTKSNGTEALAAHIQRPFPVVITDVEIPDMTGIELLQLIKDRNSFSEVVVMNNQGCLDTAINAIRAGAYDYLIKPFENKEIVCNIAKRALEKHKLHWQNQTLIEALKQHNKALETTNKRLKKLATIDDLTGLHNHRYFQERFRMELNRSKRYPNPFSILFIDLDHFKIYNDTNGHLAGDQLLKTLSALLQRCFRMTDMIARYGGDEFVVLLPETSKAKARFIAANLHKRVSAFPFGDCEKMPGRHITVSIGIASYPEDGATPNDLLHQADQMLYRGKKKRGQFTL